MTYLVSIYYLLYCVLKHYFYILAKLSHVVAFFALNNIFFHPIDVDCISNLYSNDMSGISFQQYMVFTISNCYVTINNQDNEMCYILNHFRNLLLVTITHIFVTTIYNNYFVGLSFIYN